MSSQPWGNFSEILNQANEGYQRPFDPDGPHNVGEALFGDTFGFGGGADDLSLAYSVTNAEESHYADDFEPSGQDTVETKQLNLELNDLLIQDDELQVINEAVERVRRQAARHYLHVRVNGGDKNHWRVGPDPLQNIQEEGVSADYIKTLLTNELAQLSETIAIDADEHLLNSYKKTALFGFILPKELKEIASQMLEFSFDMHRQNATGSLSPGGSSAQPIALIPGSSETQVAGALESLKDCARFFKLEDDNLIIHHFNHQLLNELLMLSMVTILTKYPHLRGDFGENRLSRLALVMPSTEMHRFWEDRETGYVAHKPAGKRAKLTVKGEERKTSVTGVLNFTKRTEEGKRMAANLGTTTKLLFVPLPPPLEDRPSVKFAKVAYFPPRHRYKPPSETTEQRTISQKKKVQRPMPYARPAPVPGMSRGRTRAETMMPPPQSTESPGAGPSTGKGTSW